MGVYNPPVKRRKIVLLVGLVASVATLAGIVVIVGLGAATPSSAAVPTAPGPSVTPSHDPQGTPDPTGVSPRASVTPGPATGTTRPPGGVTTTSQPVPQQPVTTTNAPAPAPPTPSEHELPQVVDSWAVPLTIYQADYCGEKYVTVGVGTVNTNTMEFEWTIVSAADGAVLAQGSRPGSPATSTASAPGTNQWTLTLGDFAGGDAPIATINFVAVLYGNRADIPVQRVPLNRPITLIKNC